MCRQNPKISSWDTLDFVENQANFNNIRSWGTLLLSHFNQFCRLYTTSTCYTSAEIFILAHSSCRNVTSFFQLWYKKEAKLFRVFSKKKKSFEFGTLLSVTADFWWIVTRVTDRNWHIDICTPWCWYYLTLWPKSRKGPADYRYSEAKTWTDSITRNCCVL